MIRYFTHSWASREDQEAGKPPIEVAHDFAESDLLEAARLEREHPEPENAAKGAVFEALCWLSHQRGAPYQIIREEII